MDDIIISICSIPRSTKIHRSHLSEHVEYSNDRDEHGGLGLVEAHAHTVVGDVHVGHVVPHVQQEVGDGENQESRVREVGEVQHVHDEVPEVPQTGVPLKLENVMNYK